jgi:hypothetical protein
LKKKKDRQHTVITVSVLSGIMIEEDPEGLEMEAIFE